VLESAKSWRGGGAGGGNRENRGREAREERAGSRSSKKEGIIYFKRVKMLLKTRT